MKKTITVILIVIIAALIGIAIYAAGTKNQDESNSNTNISSDKSEILAIVPDDLIRGNKDAKITIVEYSDFQCPYCIQYHNSLLELIQNNSNVRWVYRHFPLSFHPYAKKAAFAVEAAARQNSFAEYSDKLAKNSQADGTGLKEADLIRYATEMGLDMNKFKSDLNDKSISAKIDNNAKEAQALKIQGTPASYLITPSGEIQTLSGYLTYSQLKSKIDAIQE